MNILIAPDSFKDCLSARDVAESLQRGLIDAGIEGNFEIAPMADGGEGTVESVIDATGGGMVRIRVMDPLMREIESFYGITGDGSTAIIEMAAASGLELLKPGERDPWVTTTYGTGQLIRNALEKGCNKILLGIGGSATNDCGAGMAEALGVKFTDRKGVSCRLSGGYLGEVDRIWMDGLHPGVKGSEILVACDVSNPLTGPSGASHTYGPQKGADPEMVRKLDRNLAQFAELIREQLGMEIDKVPGAGAAGGLGAGLMAFLNGRLMNGFDMIAGAIGLEEKIKKADLVITGEGKMDGQTQFGKTPFGVAQLAYKHGKPAIGVAGTVEEDARILYQSGFRVIMPILEKPSDLSYAIENASALLERTGERIGRFLKIEI